MIRIAERKDIPSMLEIYAPYVRNTAVSFEYEVPSLDEFTHRYEEITAAFPWLVWEEDGQVIGYAYAHKAFARAAFGWDAELSIYLREDKCGNGIGQALYVKLEQILYDLGYCNLYGLITKENEGSCRFHERLGYHLMGILPQTGYKFGRWYSLCWYGKKIRKVDEEPAPVKAFTHIEA